jgi:hypothetical protein
MDKVQARGDAAAEPDRAASDALQARASAHFTPDREAQIKALGERVRAAQARGDQAALMALADSAQRIMRGEMKPFTDASMAIAKRAEARGNVMMAEAKACGALPPEPVAPPPVRQVSADTVPQIMRAAGRAASGLSDRQYEVLRERVEEYVRLGGRTRRSSYRFAAGELAALERRLADLKGRPALVADVTWTPESGA